MSCLHPLLLAFESLVVLGEFDTGWLNSETKSSCPDFGLHARVRILTLERALHCCLSARAGFSTLGRSFPSSSISSAELYAHAGVLTLERVVVCDARAVRFDARAETWFCKSSGSVYPPLERDC